MADEIQAQAGDDHQPKQAAESQDAPDTQINGTNPMADYEAEFAKAMSEPQSEEEQGGEPAESEENGGTEDADDSEGEEQISESAESQEEAEEEEEQEQETEPKVSDRFRFKSDEDKAVAALAKAEKISLVEAAKRYDALKTPTKREAETESEESDPNAGDGGGDSESAKTVNDAITQLRQQRKEAWDALDMEKVEELDGQIDGLRDKLMDLKIVESQAKSEARAKQAQENAEATAEAEAKSIQFYPDLQKPDSELNAEYWRLQDAMKEKGDPILERPDASWLIAKQAAKNLGIPMADLQQKAAPAKKSAQKRPVQPAGGNASTTVPTEGSSRIEQAVDNIGSEYDYEQVRKSLLQRAG